jgi:hypothetical protein
VKKSKASMPYLFLEGMSTWVNQRLDTGICATVISMSSQVDAIGQIVRGSDRQSDLCAGGVINLRPDPFADIVALQACGQKRGRLDFNCR